MAFRSILRASFSNLMHRNYNPTTLTITQSRTSSFRSSEFFKGVDKHPEVEVIQNPPDWKFVEELIGKPTIPLPLVKAEYPSGWTPPDPAKYKNLPYFVGRTKNFMVPVYLRIKYRGQVRRSVVRNIEGDIWRLERELNQLIEKKAKKKIFSRINEMNRQILFKGDYVTLIQKYLISKGL